MTMEIKKENGQVVVKVDGRLDIQTSVDFVNEINTLDHYDALVIDFEGVSYISSAGIRAIIQAYKKSTDFGAKFQVINIQPAVMELFSMTGIDKKLDLKAL